MQLVSITNDHTLKSRMRGNSHVRFGIGGGTSDFIADHTKEKREMKDPHQITMKNGKPAMQGICTVCGTKLTRILSSQKP